MANPIHFLPDCLYDNAQDAKADCVQKSIIHFTDLLLMGIALGAFFYLLYGAFLYVSAFGDESKTASAKKTITSALIGVILAVLAYTLITIVGGILGVKITFLS